MPFEMETFQNDLLESVKQMRYGQTPCITHVELPESTVEDPLLAPAALEDLAIS
jgi:hypothetical protein